MRPMQSINTIPGPGNKEKNSSKSCKNVSPHPYPSQSPNKLTQWGEEPSVLSRRVSLLQCLLDSLLRILPLGNLLECLRSDNTLQSFQLECVTCGHQVVVVDHLDEWLDLGSLVLAGFRHAAGDLRRVTLDTSNQGVRVWVRLVSNVLGLDDYDLRIALSALPLTIPALRIQFLNPRLIRLPIARSWGGGRVKIYLLSGISASGNDGHTADFEDCEVKSALQIHEKLPKWYGRLTLHHFDGCWCRLLSC